VTQQDCQPYLNTVKTSSSEQFVIYSHSTVFQAENILDIHMASVMAGGALRLRSQLHCGRRSRLSSCHLRGET